jgi:hypothetical protein
MTALSNINSQTRLIVTAHRQRLTFTDGGRLKCEDAPMSKIPDQFSRKSTQ